MGLVLFIKNNRFLVGLLISIFALVIINLSLKAIYWINFNYEGQRLSEQYSCFMEGNLEKQDYALKPLKNCSFRDTFVSINSQGLRDYEYSIGKVNDTYRIIIIGDSFTFGDGINLEGSFSKKLEPKLNKEFEKNIEVINFGVPGADTRYEYELFKDKALAYNPDLIIFAYYINDIEIIIDNDLQYFNANSFYNPLLNQAYYIYNDIFNNQSWPTYYAHSYSDQSENWLELSKYLTSISELSDNKGHIKLCLLILPDMLDLKDSFDFVHLRLAEEAKSNNFVVIDSSVDYPDFRYNFNKFVVSTSNRHTNLEANDIISENIIFKYPEIHKI